MLVKVRAMTSPGLIPAEMRRLAAKSTRRWRPEWVRSNFPATEIARREGNLSAARWRSPVSVAGDASIVLR